MDWLTLSQTTNFRLFQTERVCRQQFEIDENYTKFLKRVENTVRKREICSFRAITHFPTVFKGPVLQKHKKTGLVWERVKHLLEIVQKTWICELSPLDN